MSALSFRNVDASPADPVSEWPQEAIQTALERGGLTAWRRLAAAIRADPWGPVVRRIEDVLTYSRPYGVAAAFDRAIARSRDAAEAAERDAIAAEISKLIADSGRLRLANRDVGLPALDLCERQGHPIGGVAVADATLLKLSELLGVGLDPAAHAGRAALRARRRRARTRSRGR